VSRAFVFAIFILSGAAGLIYEVVWARQLVLVFGNTTQAISAILTGFFAGMAIGSVVGGRIADRVRRPLRLYAWLELALVAVVLATPLTFRLLHEVYRGAFGTLETQPALLTLLRFGLALLALGPATVMMGATLPTLTRYLSRDAAHLSQAFGRLYAANTIGAIIGTVAAGFVLIETIGLTGTLAVGAACSATAGLSALAIDRRSARRASVPAPSGSAPSPSPSTPQVRLPGPDLVASARSTLRLGLAIAFVSGLTSLGYQTLWTRLLAAGTGNSTYVFTLILTFFLAGIALGALVYSAFRSRIGNVTKLLAYLQLLTAVIVVIGAMLVVQGTATTLEGYLRIHEDPGVLGPFVLLTALVVLPATLLMGVSFPAASALVAGGDGEVGSRAGLVVAVNTVGAIVGTFAIPFVVIPLIGSANALGLLAIVNALMAVGLILSPGVRGRVARRVVGVGGSIVAGALAISLVSGGFFVDPTIARIERLGGVVSSSLEDEIASVQAGYGPNGAAQLWVTGTAMTLLTVDAKLMPVLPLIARPNAKTALVVAFGMGSAFRGALNAGLTTEAVELVPSVPKMFHVYYPDADSVLWNPNGRVIVTDGRNHLELTDHRYDVIITDPPPPIESAGVSVISSREYYQAGRDHLNPGGVMMQWMPWGQTLDAFKAHVRTFRDVFPHVLIAFGPGGYGLFMLGSEEPLSLDRANVQAILARPGITEDISSAYDSPEHDAAGWADRIASLVWISGDQVARFAGDGPLITDDRPLPEYFLLGQLLGPKSLRVTPGLLRLLTPSP
jgi:spermidine synthase